MVARDLPHIVIAEDLRAANDADVTGSPPAMRTRLRWWVGALGAVIYGSLIPFEFQPRPVAEAWAAFLGARWFDVGLGARADWIANLLLYVPVGFTAAWLLAGRAQRGLSRLTRLLAAVVLCASIAVIVEFAQLFFPPRTVSLGDVIAEWLGAFGGAVLWRALHARIAGARSALAAGGPVALRVGVVLYTVAYLATSLFPYDFLLSRSEIAWKLGSGLYHPILVTAGCATLLRCGAKLIVEVVATIPLGVFIAVVLGTRSRNALSVALLWGAGLGLMLEALQFFVASGISQGVSVVTRALGTMLGLAVLQRGRRETFQALRPLLRPAVAVTAVPYFLLVAALNGWFSGPWLGASAAWANAGEVRLLPFYYHYYSAESVAFSSALLHTAMYMPIGVGGWLWRVGRAGRQTARGARPAMLYGAVAAAVMEAGKLFLPGRHPDPSDVLIGAFGAGAGFAVASALWRWSTGEARVEEPTTDPPPGRGARTPAGAAMRRALATAILIAVGWLLVQYPLVGGWLAAALLVYGATLWRYPSVWLVVVPALLPVLDLAPWTGWFFIDEFDLFVLVTLAVGLWRSPLAHGPRLVSATFLASIGLVGASYAISASVLLVPLPPLDLNAFSNYYSPYNALRVAKGFLWAAVLFPGLLRSVRDGIDVRTRLTAGMLLGLVGLVALVLWERLVFSGLTNFDNDYRITPFSSMHTGGAYVDAYLALALPFLAAWILRARSLLARLAGLALFGLGSYAVMVTFSRGAYAAFAVGLAVLGAAASWHTLRSRSPASRRLIVLPALLLVAAAAAVPVLRGSYIQDRFARIIEDVGIRRAHWIDAWRMRDGDWRAAVFGLGPGSFPARYFAKHEAAAPATYRFETAAGNTYLRLRTGDSLYFEQLVRVRPGRRYTLSVDLRAASPGAALTIPVCEKSLQYSYRCRWPVVAVQRSGEWERHDVVLDSGELATGPWWSRRPVRLSLYNSSAPGTVVDVDNVRLVDANGADLVYNGDFSRGIAGWFFTIDNHRPWHIFNLAVHLVFEQGWFGLLAVGALVGYALARLLVVAWRADLFAVTLLSSLAGFLTVGLVDSLVDAPRVAFLFYFLLFVAGGPARCGRSELRGATDALGTGRIRPAAASRSRARPRRRRRFPPALAVALLGAGAWAGCATTRTLPPPRAATEVEKGALGQALVPLMLASGTWRSPAPGCAAALGVVPSPAINLAVAPHAQCRFTLLVTEGGLASLTDLELQAALAHELGHVLLGHFEAREARGRAERRADEAVGSAGAVGTAAASMIPVVGPLIGAGIVGAQLIADVAVEGTYRAYDRQEEAAADRFAARLLERVQPGRCGAVVELFERLDRESRRPAWQHWLGTHPHPRERVAAVKALCPGR